MNKSHRKHKLKKQVIDAGIFNISKDMIADDALHVIYKLKKHGFDGFIVGGAIRDLLLGHKPKDFDIVTNATPSEIKKIFKHNALIIGRRFKIVHVIFHNINPEKLINNRPVITRHVLEVSTYRSSTIARNKMNTHGRIVDDNSYGTQKEDALRRDFTVNAILYDPYKNTIIDYHGGVEDIKNRMLRMIGDPMVRYTEDPVRILRAIRLASKLELNQDKNMLEAINQTKNLLLHEDERRLFEEMLKMLLSGDAVSCVRRLREIKLPKGIFLLLDKLFLSGKIDKFALLVLEKTDLRLKSGSDVSAIFILSSMVWSIISIDYKYNLKHMDNHIDAMNASIENNVEKARKLGITKNTYELMAKVWILQAMLDECSESSLAFAMASTRIRQAWHLLSVRHAMGEVSDELYTQVSNMVNAQETNTINPKIVS